MKSKKLILAGAILIACVGVVGLKGTMQKEAVAEANQIKKVKTTTLERETYAKTLDYLGYVKAKDTKTYAFLSGGQLEEVYVEEGQKVKAGDVLAKLDTSQLAFALENNEQTIALAERARVQSDLQFQAANEALSVEELNLEKLKQTYKSNIYALEKQLKIKKDNLEVTKALFEIGGASQNEYDQRQIDYDLAVDELETVQKNKERDFALAEVAIENARLNVEKAKLAQHDIDLNQAQIAKDQSLKNIEDALLVADADGYVVAAPYQKGEVVGAGSPIVSVRSEAVTIGIGVSVEDYRKISKDSQVIINEGLKGKVDTIAAYPDEATKMYSVQILADEDFTAGEVVDVKIVTDQVEGYFLPLESIFEKNGLDYVYTVSEEGKVVRTQVTLGQIKENQIEVMGVEEKAVVVVQGLKSLKENEKVELLGSEE